MARWALQPAGDQPHATAGVPGRAIGVCLLVVCASYNNLANLLLEMERLVTYLAANGGFAAAAALAGARLLQLRWSDLGLSYERRYVVRGLGWGLAVGLSIGAPVILAAPLVDLLGLQVADARVAGITGPDLGLRVGARFLLGTAIVEELVFRGVLYGWLRRRLTPWRAAAASAAGFGLWHVVPTIQTLEKNELSAGWWALAVPGAVALTFLGGILLAFLREKTGSLLSPIAAHWLINSLAATGAFLAIA